MIDKEDKNKTSEIETEELLKELYSGDDIDFPLGSPPATGIESPLIDPKDKDNKS